MYCVNEIPTQKRDFGDCWEHRTLKFMGVLLVSNKGTSTSARTMGADVAVINEQINNFSAFPTVLSNFDSQLLPIGKVSSSDRKVMLKVNYKLRSVQEQIVRKI
uniref:Uncharacterized protein n=1 Tax=Glossina austeni TaxID=7395 RepID=A0A1A9V6S7_GLOAU